MTCAVCSGPLTGQQRFTCSPTCKRTRDYELRKAKAGGSTWSPEVAEKQRQRRARLVQDKRWTCEECGILFGAVTEGRPVRYCSTTCEGKAKAVRYKDQGRIHWPASRVKVYDCSDGCGALVTFHGSDMSRASWRCVSCSRRPSFVAGSCRRCGACFVVVWNNSEPGYCSESCMDLDCRDRRRARLRDAFVEPVYRSKVFERDRWRCGICGKPTRKTAKVPDYLAPTLDHIVPLAASGAHSMANVQCAHFICNARKQDRGTDQLRLVG